MGDVARTGSTVLFVSHQMNQIRRICRGCIWLDAGGICMEGSTPDVVTAYEASFTSPVRPKGRLASSPNVAAQFTRWEVGSRAEQPNVVDTFGPVTIQFTLEVHRPLRDANHGIALCDNEGEILWGHSFPGLDLASGIHRLRHAFPSLPLQPGAYHWLVSLWCDGAMVDKWYAVPPLIVATQPVTHSADEWQGVLNLNSEFAVE